MGEDAGYGTQFREGLLDNGVSDIVVRGGDRIDQATIDALPVDGRLKIDPDNKYGDRRNSLVKNEDGSLGFYEGSEHILDYDDLADYQRFNPEIKDVAVLDNTIIRSPNAAFDPEYTGSNIMGGAAGTAGLAGLLAAGQSDDSDASVASLAARGLRLIEKPQTPSGSPSGKFGSIFDIVDDRGAKVGDADMKSMRGNRYSANHMFLRPEHRGTGIMNEAYDAIEEVSGRTVVPSEILTEDGLKFWMRRDPQQVQELIDNGAFEHFYEKEILDSLFAEALRAKK